MPETTARIADQPAAPPHDGRASCTVRLAILAGTLALVSGALLLTWVRGEAMMIDLYAAGRQLLCL